MGCKFLLAPRLPLSLLAAGCATAPAGKLGEIRRAVDRCVPHSARVRVDSSAREFAKPPVVISAHLLDGYPPDDTSPYVRRSYTTQEFLEALARTRSGEIYRAVLSDVSPDGISELRVRCRHGVRTYYGSWGGPSWDLATTIYETALQASAAEALRTAGVPEEAVEEHWRVTENRIPSLTIIAAGWR